MQNLCNAKSSTRHERRKETNATTKNKGKIEKLTYDLIKPSWTAKTRDMHSSMCVCVHVCACICPWATQRQSTKHSKHGQLAFHTDSEESGQLLPPYPSPPASQPGRAKEATGDAYRKAELQKMGSPRVAATSYVCFFILFLFSQKHSKYV